MADDMMDEGAAETAPDEQAPQEAESIVVQIECRHAADGSKTYFVGEGGEQAGAEGEEPGMKQVASLDEALRAAQAMLQGADANADQQAEADFERGFSGGKPAGY